MQPTTALKKIDLNGQATPEQIAEWDKKYPKKWYHIENDTDIAYFRSPDRATMNFAMSRVTGSAPLDYFEDIMRETIIGGSEAMIEDDEMFIGATATLKEKLEGTKAKLVNY